MITQNYAAKFEAKNKALSELIYGVLASDEKDVSLDQRNKIRPPLIKSLAILKVIRYSMSEVEDFQLQGLQKKEKENVQTFQKLNS